MNCACCGNDFEAAAARKQCRSCALFGGCSMLKCPRCGYEQPADTRLTRWLKNLFAPRSAACAQEAPTPAVAAAETTKATAKFRVAVAVAPGAVTQLSEAPAGAQGMVARLNMEDGREVRKLMAMGVLPGTSIELLQRFPSYVFQVGYSQFTIDRDLAAAIYVQWDWAV
ncbi:MAG: ferrous iron transport protein A [Terriglobales bacterium]